MDLQALTNLFATTYNSDPNVRKAGELQIRQIAGQEGMIAALLPIIATDGVDLATRQACTVWLKNRTQTSYFEKDKKTSMVREEPMAASDCAAIKSSILPLLAASPTRAITLQLGTILKIVVQRDFPDKWPGLLQEVKAMLGSGNFGQVGAGCVAALECVRAFRFAHQGKILPVVVEELFPTLVTIATQMLSTPPSTSEDVPSMLHLILKTYKNSLTSSLSTHQQKADSLVPWGRLCFSIVQMQIPLEVVPVDEDSREKCEWWKTKKWAFGILYRLFHRYGNPSQLPSTMKDQYRDFANNFIANYAPAIFKAFLEQMQPCMAGQVWLSKKVQYQVFAFFAECVKPASTWALLKPQYLQLVSSFVYPKLCFGDERKALWRDDPVEYLRSTIDEYDNFATPVVAATSFLFSLITNRTKTTFIPVVTLLHNVLQSNAGPEQRFGALNMAAALGPFMMRHPMVREGMEKFILERVSPELTSSEPYLRAIALEIIGTVEKAGMQWSGDGPLHSLYTSVVAALDDPELPVRVHAVMCLTAMVTAHEEVKTALAPNVGKVIQDLLKMCDETDLDVLNSSMDTLVECFHTELLPVAPELAARLCQSYLRLVGDMLHSEETDDINDVDIEKIVRSGVDEEEDKTFAAMGVAKTIGTIIQSVESSSEILAQVQEVMIPVIVFTLQNKILDLFDNVYDLVDSITFKLRAISPAMWPIFEMTYKLFKSDAVAFLDEMLPSLDNFVSFGTDVFRARPDYRQMALDIYTTSIASDQLGENDRVNGCKLAESILLNLRGQADEVLQPIIVTALGHLDQANTSALRLANLEVLINAVLYNPSAALHLMESTSAGASRVFFDHWFAAINAENKLPRVHDKKLAILAICALLEMDPSGIPESLKEGWPGIVGGALKIFKELPAAIEKRKLLEESLQEDDEDDDIEDDTRFLNMEENDDDVWDEDSAYLEMLAREGERLRGKSTTMAEDEDEDEDEDSDEDIEEELGYISPLDSIDPYISFKEALTAFQMKNGPSYQAATSALDVQNQAMLMEVMNTAVERAHAGASA